MSAALTFVVRNPSSYLARPQLREAALLMPLVATREVQFLLWRDSLLRSNESRTNASEAVVVPAESIPAKAGTETTPVVEQQLSGPGWNATILEEAIVRFIRLASR
jgi:hypothetical protein